VSPLLATANVSDRLPAGRYCYINRTRPIRNVWRSTSERFTVKTVRGRSYRGRVPSVFTGRKSRRFFVRNFAVFFESALSCFRYAPNGRILHNVAFFVRILYEYCRPVSGIGRRVLCEPVALPPPNPRNASTVGEIRKYLFSRFRRVPKSRRQKFVKSRVRYIIYSCIRRLARRSFGQP